MSAQKRRAHFRDEFFLRILMRSEPVDFGDPFSRKTRFMAG
ncbi:hypothetical protein PDESU_03699 [Pontiella desulfatans]|uniref:Uncharacterized protein n=1 Tax=Pontiella desulfatans TaxID=2750659 RepID=A0A6C2U5K4_PONDE|nr:hypothetical protein PDESU_03699 [Pontiella desulfatans]